MGGAADVLQEVHVETYGSLSKREKVEFILEQMRLTIAKKDYVRAAIVAGKISRKNLQEENMERYKVRFYRLMAMYHRHQRDALELAKDYHAMYSTPHVLADEHLWKAALQATVVFLALAPYGNEQQDMLNRVALDPNVEKLEACQYVPNCYRRRRRHCFCQKISSTCYSLRTSSSICLSLSAAKPFSVSSRRRSSNTPWRTRRSWNRSQP